MANGNGNVPTELQGPLAQMWRDVYRKAGEAAEERAAEQLKYHVYTYPHGAGGGGGGWTLLAAHEVTDPSGEFALRLPATGTLPQTYDSLYLELRCRDDGVGTGRSQVALRLNPDDPALWYHYALTASDGTVSGFSSSFDSGWEVGRCPLAGSPAGQFGYITAHFPLYARTDAEKAYTALCQTTTGTGYLPFVQHAAGSASDGGAADTGPIRVLYLRPSVRNWAPGTLARVWGLSDAGSGGGGTADVTITADASIAVTEAPANMFALATRISPDAGNALSLHANGLFATGGGGGTGNTTMYTQTTSPTGATNSLWFNPSETA